PACAENAKKMPAGKENYVAVDGPYTGDDAIRAGADLGQRFATRAAIAEKLPVGPGLADIGRLLAFIVSVIPLDEIRIHLSLRAKAGQLASSPGGLQRTGQHLGKSQPLEPPAEAAGVAFAAFGERNVGQTGVLARNGPFRFAVAGQVDSGERLGHGR